MSQIIVNYTPQFDSGSPFVCHRICFRLRDASPSEDYCCMEDDTESFIGVAKQFTIDLLASPDPCGGLIPDFDPTDCPNVIYEGYVQPCCEDILSTDGRVYWTATFCPS